MNTEVNPYLAGNYKPIPTESDHRKLQVKGMIPKQIRGLFARNGPNPKFNPHEPYHWFDGDGMLHGVSFRDGEAHYLNRFIKTANLTKDVEAGQAVSLGAKDRKRTAPRNPSNTALLWHHGKLLSLYETSSPYEINRDTFETVGLYDFRGAYQKAFTAHPKVDPVTGDLIFIGYDLMSPKVSYGVFDVNGDLKHQNVIPIPYPVMMHDVAITQNYTILLHLPLELKVENLAKGLSPWSFDRHKPARFGVLPRFGRSDEIQWFETDPCYIFHIANAYEDGGDIVLDAARLAYTDVLPAPDPRKIKDEDHWDDYGRLSRFTFNLESGSASWKPLLMRRGDFNRINEAYVGRRHDFSYMSHFEPETVGMEVRFNGLTKFDHRRQIPAYHLFPRGTYGGEGVFIPDEERDGEDAGWLATFVHDDGADQSSLILVDCQNFEAPPVAEIVIPSRVPYGTHGLWIE